MSKVYNNTPVVKVDKKEVSTNVINGTVTVDYMNELLKNQTREFTFITFDGFRMALGKNNGWGKKVFFETMQWLKVICKASAGASYIHPDGVARPTASTYLPCKEGAELFPELFVYDYANKIWGFDGTKLYLIDDDFIVRMEEAADELRGMYKEEDRIKSKARQSAQKRRNMINGGKNANGN